uniref:uncharacterized protein LOC120343021 n=1 Tax=Styela clava TaxID=7725 RepID=UPI0019398256|nr:uncharacterized protein LOC120343021 [Styela clava]
MKSYCNTCFTLLLICNGLILFANGYSLRKPKEASSIFLIKHDLRLCFDNLQAGRLVRSIDGEDFCNYNGKNYTFMQHIFDPATCRSCICLAPHTLYCCQAELVPEEMPPQCKAVPDSRHSPVPPLRHCLAPLIENNTSSRRPEACKDRNLREALSGTKLLHVGGGRSGILRIMAVKSMNTNAKRHSGDKTKADIRILGKLILQRKNFIDIKSDL